MAERIARAQARVVSLQRDARADAAARHNSCMSISFSSSEWRGFGEALAAFVLRELAWAAAKGDGCSADDPNQLTGWLRLHA
jgi:hypothetical protein